MSKSGSFFTLKRQPFSLIELLVVLSIILSVASMLMIKGADFVKKSQSEQESQAFSHLLNRTYLWAQLEQKALKIFIKTDHKHLHVDIPTLKIHKVFERLQIKPTSLIISFYPNMVPEIRSLQLQIAEHQKTLDFDDSKQNYCFARAGTLF